MTRPQAEDTKPFLKISPEEAEDIRAWSRSGRCGREIGRAMTCDGWTGLAASGRARCRECGEKIAIGSDAIPFYVSFTDGSYNSWTSVKAYIHRAPCDASEPE